MKLPRRNSLHLAAGAAALPAVSRIARAQAYPTRPVRIIVPFAPAGASDIIARLMGQWLSERLGQQFVIENRPGGGGNIGTEAVVKRAAGRLHAPPGQRRRTRSTRRSTTSSISISSATSRRSQASSRVPFVMVVNPSVPAKTVPEFIAYAKANPGKINMASAGIGSRVPYVRRAVQDDGRRRHGSRALSWCAGPRSLICSAGRCRSCSPPLSASIEYIRAGRLRALAVTTATRSEALPDIPTVGEFVPGYEASSWFGVGAPKATPAEIVDKLNKEINAGLADPKHEGAACRPGRHVLAGSPADFGKLIADETEKWGKVVEVLQHQGGLTGNPVQIFRNAR